MSFFLLPVQLWNVCYKSQWARVEIPELEFEISQDGTLNCHTATQLHCKNHIAMQEVKWHACSSSSSMLVPSHGTAVSAITCPSLRLDPLLTSVSTFSQVPIGSSSSPPAPSHISCKCLLHALTFYADLLPPVAPSGKRHIDSIYNHIAGAVFNLGSQVRGIGGYSEDQRAKIAECIMQVSRGG